VISLAEHNGSYTAAFKNAFDWLSRIDQNVWKKKPMLLLSASPGQRGGASVLETAKVSFPFLGGNVIESFPFPSFYDNFKEGSISNPELKQLVGEKIKRFEASLADLRVKEEPVN
jgi:chromate reductase